MLRINSLICVRVDSKPLRKNSFFFLVNWGRSQTHLLFLRGCLTTVCERHPNKWSQVWQWHSWTVTCERTYQTVHLNLFLYPSYHQSCSFFLPCHRVWFHSLFPLFLVTRLLEKKKKKEAAMATAPSPTAARIKLVTCSFPASDRDKTGRYCHADIKWSLKKSCGVDYANHFITATGSERLPCNYLLSLVFHRPHYSAGRRTDLL